MGPNHKITFAIVSHDQQELILKLLGSLGELTDEIDFNVALIDNLPPAEPYDLETYTFPIIYHKNDFPRGLSANLNKAFAISEGRSEYFCIVNPDVILEKGVFPILFEEMARKDIQIISPLVLDSQGKIMDSFRPIPTPYSLLKRNISRNRREISFDSILEIIYPGWIAGLFMLMPSAVFRHLGGYDEKFFLYFEDVDFCARARLAGYRIGVVKFVYLTHDAQRASHKEFRFFMMHLRSALKFFRSSVYRQIRKMDADWQ
jgi:GT2 family glycosyltransferase